MSSIDASRSAPEARVRRARAAVAAMFFTNGAVYANLAPRFPEIKADLGLGNGAYGLAVAALPAGAIALGLLAAPAVRRFGSARVATTGMMFAALGAFVAAVVSEPWMFAAALFVTGAVDAWTDVGQNAHGLRVQRAYGRSIINSLHAWWSVGAVSGGATAAAAIALGASRGVHMAAVAVVFSAVALTARRFSLPGPDVEPGAAPLETQEPAAGVRRRIRWKVVGVLAVLVALANAGSVVEDAGFSWAALYLRDGLSTSSAVASLGFTTLVGAQFVGRALSDRLVDRFGTRVVVRIGGALVAVGMSGALAWPSVAGTIVGYAAAGFGVATVAPAAMHAADEVPGLRAGSGLAVVSWLMRVGFVCSPPVVGFIADRADLRVALVVVPVAGVAIVALGRALPGRAFSGRRWR